MGQALDKDGNVLGEAEGDTRRDVLEQLEKMHPDAHEIRIRQMKERIEEIDRVEKRQRGGV